MSTILSRRGRQVRDKAEHARQLEEKYLLDKLPLTPDEQEHIRRVFEGIRQQLDAIGTKSRRVQPV